MHGSAHRSQDRSPKRTVGGQHSWCSVLLAISPPSSCGSPCGSPSGVNWMRTPRRQSSFDSENTGLYRSATCCHSSVDCRLGRDTLELGINVMGPTFHVRSHQMTVGQAGALSGPMHLIAGTAGTVIGGWLMSRPAAEDSRCVAQLLAWVIAIETIPLLAAYRVSSERAVTVVLYCYGHLHQRCIFTSGRCWGFCRT
jgi:hypothetical protein